MRPAREGKLRSGRMPPSLLVCVCVCLVSGLFRQQSHYQDSEVVGPYYAIIYDTIPYQSTRRYYLYTVLLCSTIPYDIVQLPRRNGATVKQIVQPVQPVNNPSNERTNSPIALCLFLALFRRDSDSRFPDSLWYVSIARSSRSRRGEERRG